MFLKKTVFENIASDIKNMYKKRFRKNFIMPEFKTDRKMSVLSGKEIVQHSESISNLYSSNELRNWISLFVGSPVFPIFDEDEFLVANFLDGQNDTHGWHLDDPQYALIIIIEAPTFDEGGHIEYISEWKNIAIQENFSSTTDVNQGVDICAKKKAISKDYLIKGDCYLLNAGDVLHRVVAGNDIITPDGGKNLTPYRYNSCFFIKATMNVKSGENCDNKSASSAR